MPSNSSYIDVTYDDPRTGERVRERRVQRVPYEEVEDVRNRELAVFRQPSPVAQQALIRREESRDSREDLDDNVQFYRRRVVKQRNLDVDYSPARRPRRSVDDRDDRYRSSRRREPSSSSSDSESSRERRRRRRHRRARSERGEDKKAQEPNEEGITWYSGKPRGEASILERHFDPSYDGIWAGLAGAAIGAMTVRRLGPHGDNRKKWETLAGAAVGAATFNVAEHHYRVYTEERQEKKQERKQKTKQVFEDAEEPMELVGGVVQEAGTQM